jgi:mono/diheme cytochrome c family protein
METKALKSRMPALAAVVIASVVCVAAWALPPYQQALFERYPNAVAALPNCIACHDGPGANVLNDFASAFLANGFVLNATLEALDSDGDGATNGEELTASPATGPGDPLSRPGVAVNPPSPPAPATDGPMLYANNCAACHQPLATSTKAGATLSRMQSAIAGNVGGMGYLSGLSLVQLQAIEAALAPVTMSTPGGAAINYTGMWWNPAESGWSISVNHQGKVAFATLYTYDEAGAPMWLVMSSGLLQADGRTYTGDLYRTNGPAFNAQPFTPITAANLLNVGRMSLMFSTATTATLSYTYLGTAVSKNIVPFVFGTMAASCTSTTGNRSALSNYQDTWWNPAESGWGLSIVHQDNTLSAALSTYDLAGNNLWLVSPAILQPDGSYLGDLYRTSGPAFNAQPFTPITGANIATIGTMRFTFSDGMSGTLAYTVNGVPVSKSITRLVFGDTVPACSSPSGSAPPAADGPTLYANNCAACHRPLATSTKAGATLARMRGAIAGNVGGMGYLSSLSTAQLQAIVAALAPIPPTTAPACGSCHGLPPRTGQHDKHRSRSCSTCHGAGYSSTTVNAATHNNGVTNLAESSIGWNATSRSCTNSCHGRESW